MIISLFLIVFSAALGMGGWFVFIGVVFSIGGGDLYTETHYDSLVFNFVILLLIIVFYFNFAKHLIIEKKQPLLLVCIAATIVFFLLTPWIT